MYYTHKKGRDSLNYFAHVRKVPVIIGVREASVQLSKKKNCEGAIEIIYLRWL